MDDLHLRALADELEQARRHLGALLGLPVPLEPREPGLPGPWALAELAQRAARLEALAERAGGRARAVRERVRRVEAELQRGGYPTV